MSSLNIPLKTPEGVAELSSRLLKLSQRHRTVLLLVDGRRPELQVRQMAVAAGAAESCFDELVSLGLIALPQAEPVAVAPVPTADMPAEPQVLQADPAPGAQTQAEEPAPVLEASVVSEPELPLVTAAVEPTPAPPPEISPETSPDSVVSLLPASLSLQPESSLMADSTLSGLPSGLTPLTELEDILEEARGILLRAVRAEAPVTGSLTMLRLRRARSRGDLDALLDEVESRITKPNKGLWAAQTMERARELLHTHAVQSMPMPFS